MAERTGTVQGERGTTSLIEKVARRRVALGFVSAALALWLARPTPSSLTAGASVALVGELLRIWASGHLHKGSEVTASGPYRWFAHPLYVGSSILGAGFAIASHSVLVAARVALYLVVTLTAAVRTEEARLRGRVGDRYDKYRRGAGDAPSSARPFSMAQVLVNREHRAVAGVVLV
ncbi:MAG: isoprenylcysteine carboxylmethyltransferase family protein, partial [Vicinamibacterales bacterium]